MEKVNVEYERNTKMEVSFVGEVKRKEERKTEGDLNTMRKGKLVWETREKEERNKKE